ncbi:ABC transporter ATP-binding protein [Cryptosporangium arvum]|uniref:ABC-type multidrug transport system, ATPase component n=1 Tax=Cryptosporangium arvum DSM 44712 TaxID=927661 RepID=A0A010ZVP5_9ACTN|nr:ABC transporter ATP-binding protein [Cryptosporangium arvum]EXG81262.1 ABC-type multidrug transport system, ATPase component [Cryptosporangium arvum DSM 44712]
MPAITARGLRKSYAGRTVVDGIDLDINEGEIFAVLGHNGAGKTTTVEMISGVRHRDGGEVNVLGLDPDRDAEKLSHLVGVQLQDSQLPDKMRVSEAIELYSSFYRNPVDGGDLLERLHLTEHRNRPFAKLSGGQKQRLAIALALVGRPRVAVLDELTTGLDPKARRETWGLIEGLRDDGVTVVLVTHFMEEAEFLADRLALFENGKIVTVDTPAGLINQRTDGRQEIKFRLDEDPRDVMDDFRALADVRTVQVQGQNMIITGTGDVILAVTAHIARAGLTARDLRVHQATLDDALLTSGSQS